MAAADKKRFSELPGSLLFPGGNVSIRTVLDLKSITTWSVACSICTCGSCFMWDSWNQVKTWRFSCFINIHCNIWWFSYKQTIVKAAFSIVNSSSTLAISEEMATDGVDCVFASKTTTSISEALLVEALWLDANLLCTALTSELRGHCALPCCACGLVIDGVILLYVKSCPSNVNGDVAWNTRSCRAASFLHS